jgi:hypothetical protein
MILSILAGVAKLEYARDLGSRGRETVRVRVPPSAPNTEMSKMPEVPKITKIYYLT